MNNLYDTHIEIAGHQFACRVAYRYYAGSQGATDGGLQIEPNEASSVEIERVNINHGGNLFFEIDLPQIVLDDIAGEILEEQS